ncbi:MAG: UDP-N-acetylmuramate dehydrogenase [bacterium]
MIKENYDFGSLHGYKTKGTVKQYMETSSLTDLVEVLRSSKESNTRVVACGDGSNTLIRDYFNGLFIKWTKEDITPLKSDTQILLEVSSAVKKSDLIDYCIKNSFSGLEFWAGIPGLVGGGTAMNAGAYGLQGQDSIVGVEIVTPNGVVKKDNKELNWFYRQLELPQYSLIVSSTFCLKKGDKKQIKEKIDGYIKDRECKHPLDFPSCGSVFKNPHSKENPDKGAWWFINESGLSGLSIGGAKVSEKHTNFIINTGNATSSDIINLIQEVKNRVNEKFSVQLEEEIKIF